MQAYKVQMEMQKHFVHEHPKESTSWEMLEVQFLVSDPRVQNINGPMCRWSLKDRKSTLMIHRTALSCQAGGHAFARRTQSRNTAIFSCCLFLFFSFVLFLSIGGTWTGTVHDSCEFLIPFPSTLWCSVCACAFSDLR